MGSFFRDAREHDLMEATMKKLTTGLVLLLLAAPLDAQAIKGAKAPGPVKEDLFNDRSKVDPRRGGELTQVVRSGFRSLDPDQDNSATTSEIVHMYIQEGLVDSDVETWDSIPKLAERWDIEDNVELKDGSIIRGKIAEAEGGYEITDLKGKLVRKVVKDQIKDIRKGTSFTFHLRKDVRFHNGQPFTARDVEFTYKLLSNPKNGMPSIQGYFAKITECKVIDDYTVRMTYSEQYFMALTVCGGYMYVRPHKAWDPDGLIDKDPDAFFKKFHVNPLMMKPIGTGPYEHDSYKKDFEVVIKRFDGYWDKGNTPQNPDRIRFRIIKDTVAQLQALKNGEVDYVTRIPPHLWEALFKDPRYKDKFAPVEIVYPSYSYIGFNLRKHKWKDRNVRRAMAHASVDINKFIREVLRGRAEQVLGPFYRYSPDNNESLKPLAYDPEKAEELFAEAGWFDSDSDGIIDNGGEKMKFEMLTYQLKPEDPGMQLLLQMQANLKKIGIDMKLTMLDWTVFLERIEQGDFDVCRLGWALSSPPNQQDPHQIWHSSSIGKAGSNHVSYANPKVDTLIGQMRRELDPRERGEISKRLQKILFDDQPYNWLYMTAELRAYNKKWRGVRFWVPRPCHSVNEWYLEK